MYLKALEIYGFKSFANKARMPLNPGITCIVGPNGCGKSNVVDSIKWCIGEMSWKSLRMPTMMDVIFAGTTRRKPLNMAEVSLTFDNAERKLPLDFNEITVTRKIYRSEESEYFINKVQCRLKDIRELFLDTGIGTDGYAIIDQGQVDRLLNASPEERREMFEEAAGVSKYKSKRDEAIGRLEKVDADLARLMDAMTLLRDQIKKLESEARKANLQQKYREELKAAEISLLLTDRREIDAEIEKGSKSLDAVLSEISSLQTSITAYEGKISASVLNLSDKKNIFSKIREEINSIKMEKSRLEGIILHNRQSLQDLQASKASLETSEKSNMEKIRRLEPYIKELEEKKQSADASIPALRQAFDEARKQMEDTLASLKSVDKEFSDSSARINSYFTREIQLSQFLARSNSDITHLKEHIIGLSRDAALLEKNVKKLEHDVESYEGKISVLKKSLQEETERNAQQEEKIRQYSQEIAKTEKRSSDIRAEAAALKARLETLLSQAKKDPYWTGQDIVLKSGLPGIIGPLRKFIRIKKEIRVSAEEALGRYIDSVVCEDMESAEKALAYLKEKGKGRCRFLVLKNVPALENNPAIFERIDCQERFRPLVAAIADGSYIDGEGNARGIFCLTGGSENIAPAQPYWGDENEIRESLAALNEESQSLEEKRKSLKNSLEQQRKQSVLSREKSVKINLELNTLQNNQKSAISSLKVNKERMTLISKTKAKSEEDLKKSQEKSEQFSKALKDAQKESEEGKKEQETLNKKRQSLNAEFARQKENFAIRRAELDNFSKNSDYIRSEIERSRSDLKLCYNEKEHFATRRRMLAEKEQEIEKITAETEKKLKTSHGSLAEKETALYEAESLIKSMELEQAGLESTLKEKRGLYSGNEKNRIRLETELAALKARAEDIERRLMESWNISLANAEKEFGGIETDRERVAFLRRRVEAMGPVNMTAPEEHEALSRRYGFIESQSEDLKKAKADLRAAISKINNTTRENFSAAFDKVRGFFKEIYALLFNGGEADLQLTMPDNLLETGVEIMAHPPGKRLVSITQLSGGEKALTALALLFSFFRVSPSPFCIMDETDAPLDEANVERFVRLIREFAPTTQFIVITHNKRTMEAAETLYGVTMEELGVSKLVSVDLLLAEKMSAEKNASSARL